MLDSIKKFFNTRIAPDKEDGSKISRQHLASAALMIEVMKADHELDERESEKFLQVLQDSLDIADEELNELVEMAQDEAQRATSLYEFTRLINDNYDYDARVGLIENMWRIAFSDEKLDKYEDHLIRRISDLIYVSHSDFIRTKLKVQKKTD